MVTPLIVFAVFSIEAKIKGTAPLSTAQAFTSLAILALLTQPAMMLLGSIPQVAAATGCIQRVQKFLLAKGFDDQRAVLSGSPYLSAMEKEMLSSTDSKSPKVSIESDDTVLTVSDLTVLPAKDAKEKETSISFEAKKGTVTMILGPVGCGKSTLLKAILGEIVPKNGTVGVNTPFIGYCSQAPWLQNATIRANIIGPNEFDREWYRTIIHTCALEEDISQMPQKDLTLIGSRGITLSGGQKHRVALARALYSRCSILVLDDFLSSIDRRTQRFIAHQLFSKDGHVMKRDCAILLATHITTFVHLSDRLLVMNEDGSVDYEGPSAHWISKNKDLAKGQDEEAPETPSSVLDPSVFEQDTSPKPTKPGFEEEIDSIKRQNGDMGVWLYYGRSIGFLSILFLAICICITVFSNNFQSEL